MKVIPPGSGKEERTKVLKAALLNPKNLFVLAVGLATGMISSVLIPIGIMAYGILCYLDLNSEDFVQRVLYPNADLSSDGSEAIRVLSDQQLAKTLHTRELRELSTNITASRERIQQIYEQADTFLQEMFGDVPHIDELVERSQQFLLKAQTIRNYLASENIDKLHQGIDALQDKIDHATDHFSQRQYQLALKARQQHLESLDDIQRMYERLVSQLTNISLSLDSIYSRMMKLKTSDYSAHVESDLVSAQLMQLLEDIDLLDAALSEHLGLSE